MIRVVLALSRLPYGRIRMKKILGLLLVLALAFSLAAARAEETDRETNAGAWVPLDYALDAFWAAKAETNEHAADTFFVLPTVNMKETVPGNEDITDERKATRFVKTYGMEKGIVEESTDVYAPLYRQSTLACYLTEDGFFSDDPAQINRAMEYDDNAYADIRAAWLYYMENWNRGRPVVLFGYSQGADMVLRLLAEFGEEEPLSGSLAAAYVIGWPVQETFFQEHPKLKRAQGETDTGVIISYNAMDERAALPETKECSINPLNWKTDSTPAANEENLGFVTADITGQITEEIPAYCGAYLDADSGKLIVTGMANGDALYSATNSVFPAGDYHLHDLNFFYRNLQKNIGDRIERFGENP